MSQGRAAQRRGEAATDPTAIRPRLYHHKILRVCDREDYPERVQRRLRVRLQRHVEEVRQRPAGRGDNRNTGARGSITRSDLKQRRSRRPCSKPQPAPDSIAQRSARTQQHRKKKSPSAAARPGPISASLA